MYPQMNPYQANSANPYSGILPPQQILTAKGKASIDTLKMSPNSSILIADETAPIIWKCTSDGLGNVSSEAWDISPHKTEEQIKQESLSAAILDLNERLKKLEESYEQPDTVRNTEKQSNRTEPRNNQGNVGNAQRSNRSSANPQSNVEE